MTSGRVATGLERLVESVDVPIPPGSCVGLLSNPSAILPDGTPALQALLRAGYQIRRIFAPEHGYLGVAQDAVTIGDNTHEGIQVVSLYGTRIHPEREHLRDLDAVLIDIQDIGCRYYTYIYTAAAIMEACSEFQVPLVVCDRPNPINGVDIEGSPVPEHAANEVGRFQLVQRYGMTIGEITTYIQNNYLPSAPLTVVRMSGWDRRMWFSDTRLPWKQPSPNLPTPETAIVYPGTCLFEGTNLSEGRGTTRPFETIGAPWVHPMELRDTLARRDLPGVAFSPMSFAPTFSKFVGEVCHGVQLHITDATAFRPLQTGLEILLAIRDQSPGHFRWRPLWEDPERSFFDHLAGGSAARELIDRGARVHEVYDLLTKDRSRFEPRRADALLYDGIAPAESHRGQRESTVG